jgi:hypothetical protein
MAVRLKCSFCETKFSWDFAALGWPEHCPKCKQFIGTDRADDDIQMPSIRTMRTKIIDSTYTQMEKGSEFRANVAAEMAGVPVSEMSSLKITDMKDGMREGDIAVKEPVAEMQRLGIKDSRQLFQGNGAEYGGQVQAGPFPNAGAKFQTAIRQQHAERTNYQAVGDLPALETFQPGYRRRA